MTSSLWAQVAWGEHPWRQSHPESWLNTGPGRLGTRPLEIFPECHSVTSDLGYKSDLCPFYILPSKDFKHSMSPPKSKCSHNPLHFPWKEKEKKSQTASTVYLQCTSAKPLRRRFPPNGWMSRECHLSNGAAFMIAAFPANGSPVRLAGARGT